MPTEIQIAVAGSGKTTEISRRISQLPYNSVSLATTFTTTAQYEIKSRINVGSNPGHETVGWFSFLLHHFVRPYIPALYPEVDPSGLCFVEAESKIPRDRGGWKYYFNDLHQPYSARLSLLAKQIVAKVGAAPFDRLSQIYSHIYIDEVQDLRGNDLEILEGVMRSKLNVFITGDPRQSVIATSKSDRLHVKYRGAQLIGWFQEQSAKGNCALGFKTETHRFNGDIAKFSDLIHDQSLGFAKTTSGVERASDHEGVFLIDVKDLDDYCSQFENTPSILWSRKSEKILPSTEVLTFGKAKGLTRERTVVIATKPIISWMQDGVSLKPESAAGFYVAATRAKSSVALVVERAPRVFERLRVDLIGVVQLWTPPS